MGAADHTKSAYQRLKVVVNRNKLRDRQSAAKLMGSNHTRTYSLHAARLPPFEILGGCRLLIVERLTTKPCWIQTGKQHFSILPFSSIQTGSPLVNHTLNTIPDSTPCILHYLLDTF